MKFRVALLYSATEYLDVEASSPEEAVGAAYSSSRATLCHVCAGHLDLEDVHGEIVYDEGGEDVTP